MQTKAVSYYKASNVFSEGNVFSVGNVFFEGNVFSEGNISHIKHASNEETSMMYNAKATIKY